MSKEYIPIQVPGREFITIRPVIPEKAERAPVKPKFPEDLSPTDIKNDLDFLIKTAIKSGATECVPIEPDQIIIEERVRWKCRIPICIGYNTNPSCPPFAPTAPETKQLVSEYKYALLYKIECPPSDILFPFPENPLKWINLTGEITGRVEAEAQYLGYYKALGFKGGLCGYCGIFSPEAMMEFTRSGESPATCNVFRNKPCRHYHRVRSAMEASGMDCYAITKKVGWDIYTVLTETDPKKTPCTFWMGLVLII